MFLWVACSGASSVSEIAGEACSGKACYVNHDSTIISPARHLPAQEYLSARDLGTQETLSASGSRSSRLFPRTVRQMASHLFSDHSSADPHTFFGLFLMREIPAHSPCGMIITNYIHLKDGLKS